MIDAANYSATETLRDGRTITIRALRPEDLDGWRAALARTSAETLHFRFFAVKREVSEKEADYFLDIDFVKHVALVAVSDEDGRPTLIGGGGYYVVEPGKAEIAFGLIDEYGARVATEQKTYTRLAGAYLASVHYRDTDIRHLGRSINIWRARADSDQPVSYPQALKYSGVTRGSEIPSG